MLLSSQAFSGFLQELSNSGLPAPNVQSSTQQTQPRIHQQPACKDISPSDAARRLQAQQQHVGMALLPDQAVDMSMLETPSSWTPNMPVNDFQVFAVTELPAGPQLDLSGLVGKPTTSDVLSVKPAKDLPVMSELPPKRAESKSCLVPMAVDNTVALDEQALTLYFEEPCQSLREVGINQRLNRSHTHFTSKDIELVVVSPATEQGSWTELYKLCSALDETCSRLDAFTSHLD